MYHDRKLEIQHETNNKVDSFMRLFRSKTRKSSWLIGTSPLALAACGGGSNGNAIPIIVGTVGDDILTNSSANERFEGGLGDDVYTVGLTGIDTALDTGGNDTIKFVWRDGTALQVDNLYSVGDNLVAEMVGQSNSMTIEGAFAAETRIENVIYYNATGEWGDGLSGGLFKFGEAITGQGGHLVVGTNNDDTVSITEGDIVDITLWGANGDDNLTSGSGAQYIWGGDGNDTVDGGDGNDFLWGDAGEDILVGGEGDDTIRGGDGDDTLTGNDGADTFEFRAGETGTDTITDFDIAEGDKLGLSLHGITTEEAAEELMSDTSSGVNVTIDGIVIVTLTATTVADFAAADGWLA